MCPIMITGVHFQTYSKEVIDVVQGIVDKETGMR
jgi:hypothetical protein